MHEAVNSLFNLDKSAERRQISHFADHLGTHRILQIKGLPGIRFKLFQAQRDLFIFLIYRENNRLHVIPGV